MAATLGLLDFISRADSAGEKAQRLAVGASIARGQYGVVHRATLMRGAGATDVVVKRADAAVVEDAALAQGYFDVELEVNEAVRRAKNPGGCFAPYLGCVDGWLVWERLVLRGDEEEARTLADFAGVASKLEAEQGLSVPQVLHALLTCTQHLHDLGYCHRDIKLENIMLADAEEAPAVHALGVTSEKHGRRVTNTFLDAV